MIKFAFPTITYQRQVYIFALLTSVMLSMLIGYRHSVINPDGICYVLSAQMMGIGGFKDAMHLCPQARWPFYSTLIYALEQLSHLSYGVSAHLLDAFLSLISVATFIKIIETLGGNQRVMWLAALVILFDHQFNILRDNIIRDHGFWSFYLISIYLLLKYFRDPKIFIALLWTSSLVIASLFRIEGAIFLMGMPFISFFMFRFSFWHRCKMFLVLNSILIAICIGLVFWQAFHPDLSMQEWGRVNEIIVQFKQGFGILVDRFQAVRTALITHILPKDALPDATPMVFLIWISWYLYNVVLTLGWSYALLILYGWRTRASSFTAQNSWIIWGYLLINVLMTLGFIAESLFISKRYLVGLTLVLMFWVPFALNDLIEKWPSMRHRIFLIFMALVFLITALSGVIEFGRSKFYIRTAGEWMETGIPANAKLYTNDYQLMYYSKHFGMHIFEVLPSYMQVDNVTQGKWKNYDYLALRLRKHGNDSISPLLNELQNRLPIKIFNDKQGNRIAVYQITPPLTRGNKS